MFRSEWKLPELYQDFRLNKINDDCYSHLKLLLFWPVYFLRYPLIEAFNSPERCHLVECALDHFIPFREEFLIPYELWIVCLLGLTIYTVLYDIPAFKQYMKFLIIAFSISTFIYLIYPTYQNLRPEVFQRDNILTRIVGLLYQLDNSSNVCPSEHVIGALAVWAGAFHTKRLRTPGRMTLITILTLLISFSTVFLKQHSLVDVVAAIPVCLAAYWICYGQFKLANCISRTEKACAE